jgi:hypothetical protein
VIPRLTRLAGFKLGYGMFKVNIEAAAANAAGATTGVAK